VKRIILLILAFVFTGFADAQNCISSFSNNIGNWIPSQAAQPTTDNDAPHGNFLKLVDESSQNYESYVANETDFSGNWLLKGSAGCFCFDYYVNWSSSEATSPVKGPKIQLYGGASILTQISGGQASPYLFFRKRAVFVGNTSNPDLQDGVWKSFCLPIGLSVNGNLPSNSYGTWKIYDGTTLLTGATAAAEWDNIIQNVTGMALVTDYNSSPSEVIYFDNFCWTCSQPVCNCSSFIQYTQAPFVVTPEGDTLRAPSCNRTLGSILNTHTNYTFGVPFQTYNQQGCTTQITSVITNASNQVIATYTGSQSFTKAFTQEGDYCVTYTITVNGVTCGEPCRVCFTVKKDDACCKNTFPFWTDIVVPQSYAFEGGTYSVEDFNVKAPNTIPITEIKVTVEDFKLIGQYSECMQCYNKPLTLGSIMGGSTIGSGINQLTLQTQPYGNGNSFVANNNELIWKNPDGVTLNTPDIIRLIYLLPQRSSIPCCVDSAQICIRISYRDVNCGYCEVYNCTTVPLQPKAKQMPGLGVIFQNSKGIYQPKIAGF